MTILKNLELRNFLSGVILAFIYDLVEVVLLMRHSNLAYVKIKVKAYLWIFKNLGHILEKRHIIQKNRLVSDKWLRDMSFIVTPNEAFHEYTRLGKLFLQI